ncbi:hypothetical protein PG997_012350 [Apiospora hydei]|uniref:3'-5' exonuclease domain-containing protein n=1 Tax=Apiospora hydei TaxID=1337664 RepID=A0ABR1V358_9PEZI
MAAHQHSLTSRPAQRWARLPTAGHAHHHHPPTPGPSRIASASLYTYKLRVPRQHGAAALVSFPMIPKGISEAAGNALTSSRRSLPRYRCASLHELANSIPRYPSMNTSPASQLWHPSRGISFSPTPAKSWSWLGLSDKAPPQAAATEESQRDASVDGGEKQCASTNSNDALATADEAAVDSPVLDPPDRCVPSDENTNDPPYPALKWRVSEPLFRAAKSAAPGTPESFWSYKMYRGPGKDGSEQPVKVHYCKSRHTTDRVCEQYFMNEKVLGFDLEWVAESTRLQGPRRNVSLIQLASPSRIALFHVACFPKEDNLVSPMFKKIMEDSNITKVGVWIKGDATRLRTHLGIDSKDSASDAYAGVHLYATLEHHRNQLNPCPPTPHHAELNLPIRFTDGSDLETSSDEELAEQPEAEDDQPQTLSPTARRRLLKAHVQSKRGGTKDAAKTTSGTEKAVRPRDARVETAEAWAAVFRKENQPTDPVEWAKSGCASLHELRAYHIWHTNKGMSAADIAGILRSPPLVTKTVVGYIWGAVRKERLPVDRRRYMAEVVQLLPEKQSRIARQALTRSSLV